LSETVRDLGYELEGPFADNRNALRAIENGMPDCAILDVHTADGDVYPVADRLAAAGVPMVFHSGHVTPAEVNRRYPDAVACTKPCPPGRLIDALQEAVGRVQHSPGMV